MPRIIKWAREGTKKNYEWFPEIYFLFPDALTSLTSISHNDDCILFSETIFLGDLFQSLRTKKNLFSWPHHPRFFHPSSQYKINLRICISSLIPVQQLPSEKYLFCHVSEFPTNSLTSFEQHLFLYLFNNQYFPYLLIISLVWWIYFMEAYIFVCTYTIFSLFSKHHFLYFVYNHELAIIN